MRIHFPFMPDLSSANPAARDIAGFLKSRQVIGGVVLAVLVLTALALFGDARALITTLRGFTWWLAPPIILLTIWNYLWRFLKWELYLQQLEVPRLPSRLSLLVFLSAFAMSLTPGKVGELLKSVYLRRFTGAPINRTSAIIAAERITDAAAMVILATVGLTQFTYGRPFVAILAMALLGGLLLLQRPGLLGGLLSRLSHRPVLGRTVAHALAFLDASGKLYRARTLTLAVAIGLISWAGECVAFLLVLVGLGLDASWHLLLVATFVLAVSSLAGGASMLPGGLGVADASVAAMLLLLVPDDAMTRSIAVAATLLIRFATLWFAVLVGALAVFILERMRVNSDIPRANDAVKPDNAVQRDRERAPNDGPSVRSSINGGSL